MLLGAARQQLFYLRLIQTTLQMLLPLKTLWPFLRKCLCQRLSQQHSYHSLNSPVSHLKVIINKILSNLYHNCNQTKLSLKTWRNDWKIVIRRLKVQKKTANQILSTTSFPFLATARSLRKISLFVFRL